MLPEVFLCRPLSYAHASAMALTSSSSSADRQPSQPTCNQSISFFFYTYKTTTVNDYRANFPVLSIEFQTKAQNKDVVVLKLRPANSTWLIRC
jgi:hypothetical protein